MGVMVYVQSDEHILVCVSETTVADFFNYLTEHDHYLIIMELTIIHRSLSSLFAVYLYLSVCSSECKIIFRGPRSLGYGFVTFEKEADAKKALDTLHGAELDTREVKIEMASPRVAREEGDKPARRSTGARRGRGARSTRPPRSHEGEEKSKTTVFVGNLPFSVVDEDLYNIFSAFKVEKAYVVRRFNGASRGFGFVVLSEEDQQKALETLGTVICDERTLIIRAAYEDQNKNKEESGEAAAEEN